MYWLVFLATNASFSMIGNFSALNPSNDRMYLTIIIKIVIKKRSACHLGFCRVLRVIHSLS